jgi:hypothetical protein
MTRHETEQKLTHNEDSLAPFQLDRMSIEEESLVKHRGRFTQLTSLAALALCVVGGGTYLMKRLDQRQTVVSAAAGVQRVRAEKLEPFLRCALPGIGATQLNSRERLIGAIDDFSESLGKGYARTLTRCLPVLGEVAPALAAQVAPTDLRPQVRALHDSAVALTAAVQTYRDHLGAPAAKYDYVTALPLVEKIAVAWEGYEANAKRFDDAVHAKLD